MGVYRGGSGGSVEPPFWVKSEPPLEPPLEDIPKISQSISMSLVVRRWCRAIYKKTETQVQYVALRKQQKRPGSRFFNELGLKWKVPKSV